MAFLVLLKKISETPEVAEYSYGPSEEVVGRVQIDKYSGEVSLLQLAPGDTQQALFTRAAWKLEEHWEEGQFPDTSCWAS